MHYVTHRSKWKQKDKFGITCPDTLFVEFVPVLIEHEKYCVDVSRPRCNRMHFVTRVTHQMQKHKFGITCSCAVFVDLYRSHLSMKNSASTFRDPDPPERIT
jgi:hypothetical protein